jgi:hypothetical protein
MWKDPHLVYRKIEFRIIITLLFITLINLTWTRLYEEMILTMISCRE